MMSVPHSSDRLGHCCCRLPPNDWPQKAATTGMPISWPWPFGLGQTASSSYGYMKSSKSSSSPLPSLPRYTHLERNHLTMVIQYHIVSLVLVLLFYSPATKFALSLNIIMRNEPVTSGSHPILEGPSLTELLANQLVREPDNIGDDSKDLNLRPNNQVSSLPSSGLNLPINETFIKKTIATNLSSTPPHHSTSSSSTPSMDKTNSEGEGERSLIIGNIIANIIIFVIGFCGNTVVILVILKFTRTETVTDIYILNLAFADFMFITGLVFLVTTMFIDHWIFGNLMCKLYMATTSLNQFASSLLLVVMSFDRFLAVCHPIYAQRFRRLKRAKIICLGIWIICLILMTPIFAFAKTSKELTCGIFWPEYKGFNCEMAFTLYSFAIGFSVPLLLIAAFYMCVIRKLRMAATGPIGGSSRRSRSRENANRRIEHLVIGIIFTYTICWLPYWIAQLCVSFTSGESPPMEGFYEFYLVATSLSYTNSALNPILYAFLSDNFKRRCSDILSSIYSFGRSQKQRRSSSVSHPQQHVHQKLPQQQPQQQQQQQHHHHHQHHFKAHSVATTTAGSADSDASRPEAHQIVLLNESVKLVSMPLSNQASPPLVPGSEDKLELSGAIKGTTNKQGKNHQTISLASSLDGGASKRSSGIKTEPLGGHKKNSVAFSVDTIVMQGIIEPGNNKHHKI